MTDQETATDRESDKRNGRDLVRQDSQDSIFGPAPILPEEDSDAYYALLASVSADVKPADIIKKIWVRDIVNRTWEILRWRRIIRDRVAQAVPDALQAVLVRLIRGQRLRTESVEVLGVELSIIALKQKTAAGKLVKGWVAQNPKAIERVNKLLTSAKITMTDVTTNAFILKLDEIERIERLITISEERRDAILREIDQRNAAFSQALRKKVAEVEDAEFEVVEPKDVVPKNVNAA